MSRRFVFTLNNYSDVHIQELRDLSNHEVVRYLVFGRELAPTTGTPHLQGFIVLNRAQRHSWLRNRFAGIHTENARGTSVEAAEYCKKEGDFEEFGELPANQGKRTDIEKFCQWVTEFIEAHGRAPSEREIAFEQPRAFIQYNKASLAYVNAVAPPPALRIGQTREWQQDLANTLEEDADDRTVTFVVDQEGGKGKSWFQQWYITKNPDTCQVLGIGKRDNMAYAVDETKKVFLLNVPRGDMQYLQYSVLEQLKDRMVFSTKYQTRMKILRQAPHVVVFCNEYPDMEKMSADRYVILEP